MRLVGDNEELIKGRAIMEINIYGCGQMAQAIFKGLVKTHTSGRDEADDCQGQEGKVSERPVSSLPFSLSVHTYTPSYTRAQELAQALKGRAYGKIEEMPHSPYAFLALKPQQFPQLAQELRPSLCREKTTIISVMAGLTLGHLQEQLQVTKVIRVMPSTPCRVGRGISLMFCSPDVTKSEAREVKTLLEGVSTVVLCESEDELDRIMTVSSCGPAYLFELARIFSEFLQLHGIQEQTALEVVKELFAGSFLLMERSPDSFTTLRKKITSQGGATHEALAHLKSKNLEELFHQAMESAYRRAKELLEVSKGP